MYNKKIVLLLTFFVFFMQLVFANPLSTAVYAAGIVSGSLEEGVEPTTQTDVEPKLESKIIGDVNGDEKRNSIDFALMRMVLLAMESEFAVSNGVWAADLDGNGEFNSIDFAYMRQFLLGNISDFPAEKIINDYYENPFEYALLSGDKESNMRLLGEKVYISGDIHSNSGIDLMIGYGSYIEGCCKAVNTVRSFGFDVCNDIEMYVDEIDMPDLSKNFNTVNAIRFSHDVSPSSGEKFYKRYLKAGSDYLLNEYGYELHISYDESSETWILMGDTLILNQEKPYYFNGNVIINVDKVVGNGTIVAEDDITFNPGNLEESEVGLYSIYGGIQCNLATGAEFTGLLYAPGIEESEDKDGLVSGDIVVRSSNFEFNGSIVGKSLDLYGNKVIKYERTSIHEAFRILN